MTLNKAVIVGKVIEAPEARFTNSDDQVTRLLIETGDSVLMKLVCWKALAAKASSLKEGDLIMAVGPLHTSSYKSAGGQNKKDFELSVRELYLLHGDMENLSPYIPGEGKASPKVTSAPKKASKSKEEDLSDVLLEEEIPF